METGEPLPRTRVWRWLLWPTLVLSFVLFAVPQVFFIAMGLHRNLGFGRIARRFRGWWARGRALGRSRGIARTQPLY